MSRTCDDDAPRVQSAAPQPFVSCLPSWLFAAAAAITAALLLAIVVGGARHDQGGTPASKSAEVALRGAMTTTVNSDN